MLGSLTPDDLVIMNKLWSGYGSKSIVRYDFCSLICFDFCFGVIFVGGDAGERTAARQ